MSEVKTGIVHSDIWYRYPISYKKLGDIIYMANNLTEHLNKRRCDGTSLLFLRATGLIGVGGWRVMVVAVLVGCG